MASDSTQNKLQRGPHRRHKNGDDPILHDDPMDLVSPTRSIRGNSMGDAIVDEQELAEQQEAILSSLEEEVIMDTDEDDDLDSPLNMHRRRRTNSRITVSSTSSDGTDLNGTTPRNASLENSSSAAALGLSLRGRRRLASTSSLDLASENVLPPSSEDTNAQRHAANLLSSQNRVKFLKFAYSWSLWLLKIFSCNFCIFLVFCIVYGLLFWALAFRLFLQKRTYNHQQISHPLFLDFTKEKPAFDILVRQKWFLRHAHAKSNVRLGEIRIDFSVYKGWNTTKERFNIDLHVLDRHAQVMWHSKRSVILPPSITTKRKKKKWKWIPLLTSSEYVEVDETVPLSVDLLVQGDTMELDAINKRISHAHIIRISLDSHDTPIQSAEIHFIPYLSGYAYMTRYHFFISLFLMSVGLLLSVSCCYGTTLVTVCCISARRKKRSASTLTEASWSASSLRNIWASPFRTTVASRREMRHSRDVVETRVLDNIETPDSAPRAPSEMDEEGDETDPLTEEEITPRLQDTDLPEDVEDLKSPPSTLRKRG